MENRPLPIALFADENILAGLHATLYSALASWDAASPLEIHLFYENLDSADLLCLEQTLKLANKPFKLDAKKVSIDQFQNCRPLHSNWMTYGRLLLPDLLPDVPHVIYLDADLIVNTPLTTLGGLVAGLGEFALGAVTSTNFKWSMDRELCEKLGLNLEARNLNAGVLLLNLEKWRREDLTLKCLSFLEKHSPPTVDQGAMNFVFYNDFLPLPEHFNVSLTPSSPAVLPEGKIYHFVGGPKPFDFLGNIFNNHYKMFRDVMDQTACAHWRVNSFRQLARRRNMAISKSYFKAMMQKIRR